MSSTVLVSKRTVYVVPVDVQGARVPGPLVDDHLVQAGGQVVEHVHHADQLAVLLPGDLAPTKMLRCPASSASKYTITRPRATIRSSWP